MNWMKGLLPAGLVVLGGVMLGKVEELARRGNAGLLWTLGAFLSVAFVALALYYVKKFFGRKDE